MNLKLKAQWCLLYSTFLSLTFLFHSDLLWKYHYFTSIGVKSGFLVGRRLQLFHTFSFSHYFFCMSPICDSAPFIKLNFMLLSLTSCWKDLKHKLCCRRECFWSEIAERIFIVQAHIVLYVSPSLSLYLCLPYIFRFNSLQIAFPGKPFTFIVHLAPALSISRCVLSDCDAAFGLNYENILMFMQKIFLSFWKD